MFVDKERGIYAERNGAVYICKPGTFELKCPPLAIPSPFRILTGDAYDPLMVVFLQAGYIQLYNFVEMKWILKTSLPTNAGIIYSISVAEEPQLSVTLKTSRGEYYFKDDGWSILSEPLELLVVQQDQKIFAQFSELENKIAAAIDLEDFDAFKNELQKYLLCLARYASLEAFISIWYSLLRMDVPFGNKPMADMWWVNIDLLSNMERVTPLLDELRMSLEK